MKTARETTVPCVILAGGRAKPEMAAATGVTNRALILLDGKRMLDYVVEALDGTAAVGEIFVVGDLPKSERFHSVADAGGFVENVMAGARAVERTLPGSVAILYATADAPFLTPQAIEDFVRQALESGGDAVYPVVPVALCYARFPGIKRTALLVSEGVLTGGNLMLIRTAFLEAQQERLAQAYAARKSPLRLAWMLGLGTTFRLLATLLLRRPFLSIPRLEEAVGRLLGGTARAVQSHYPEIATDIDRSEDLQALTHRNAAMTPPTVSD